ncbi:ABC transporter ATP-binding protein [Dendrosporobacter sp. 1207_IL3150]|uniref:ABC transporter ATP-binding protein n=1 Tax=Dendrosporobacter sp. 1207_IL3150 TaxID=3084054 RepID=UPI002FD904EE
MDLSFQNININIGNVPIIRDISLDVKKGEFVGIIGPNGSGKSTLLRSAYRIIKPESGAILLNGKNLKQIKLADSAKKLGVVGQFNHLSFDFTVLEMVLMGRTPHKNLLETDKTQDFEIAMAALAKVGMDSHVKRGFSTLSGGEKQRVILARALTQQPEVLILDEPTNHLDIKFQLQLLSTVKSLGIGVLAALHDLSLAAIYCDKLYIMKDGKIMASGAPKKILTPDMVRDVYEIECDIYENPETGYLSITYHPNHRYA